MECEGQFTFEFEFEFVANLLNEVNNKLVKTKLIYRCGLRLWRGEGEGWGECV